MTKPYTNQQRWLFWCITVFPLLALIVLLFPIGTFVILVSQKAYARLFVWMKRLEGWYAARIP